MARIQLTVDSEMYPPSYVDYGLRVMGFDQFKKRKTAPTIFNFVFN